jgi:pimeloyl-ACP methyl ester carboxylesterase
MPTSAHAACDPPRCLDVAVPVPSGLRVPDSTVRILLPAGYDATSERYPVLYLLHGAGDTYATWTENTDVQAFSVDFPIIIVMPDGGHDANAGFYSDWLDGSRQWETFHTRVLRRFIDRNFRTLASRGHRAVMGLSMGGFGAMSYAARHRDTSSQRPRASRVRSTRSIRHRGQHPLRVRNRRRGCVGRPGHVRGELAPPQSDRPREGPARHRSLRRDRRWNQGGPAGDVDNPGAYAIEEIVAAMNDSFAAALDRARVPYEKDFYQGGYHGWPYWERELHWSLPQIMALIGPGAGEDGASCTRRLARIGSSMGAKRAIRNPRCP